jgi:hypothetical protein
MTPQNLNQNELKVLIAIEQLVENDDAFPTFDIVVKGLTENQIKGYLSSLQSKGYIECDGEAESYCDATLLRDSKGNLTKSGKYSRSNI